MTRPATRHGRARDGAPVALADNYGSLRGLLPIAVLPIPRRGPGHLLLVSSVSVSDIVSDSVSDSDSVSASDSDSDSVSVSASVSDSDSVRDGVSVAVV